MNDTLDAEFRETGALVVVPEPIRAPQLLDALRPAERVALMTEISNVVKDVIEKQKWFADIKGKKHILIQGWTFIGGLGGCSAKITHTEQIDGGFKAHAVVVRCDTGIEVGSAEQVCMKGENFGRGKDDYALVGMASTRACSRALSTVFRHVVELAGYSATPAEEMLPEPAEPKPAKPPKNTAQDAERLKAAAERAHSLGATKSAAPSELRAWADARGLLVDGKLTPKALVNIEGELDTFEEELAFDPETMETPPITAKDLPITPIAAVYGTSDVELDLPRRAAENEALSAKVAAIPLKVDAREKALRQDIHALLRAIEMPDAEYRVLLKARYPGRFHGMKAADCSSTDLGLIELQRLAAHLSEIRKAKG